MKLTTFILLTTSMLVSASLYSQSTRLTLKSNDISYEELFKEIENQTEFRFAFSISKLDPSQKIQINVKKKTLEEILDNALPDGIAYEIIDRYVVIMNASDRKTATESQQQKSITGKVTDETGQPLPGVTVVVKGSTRGTITDANGNYSLTNVPADVTLVFSFVGMKSQEVAVIGQSVINVTMVEETIGIEEVVAIGYGTQKKRDISSAISSVSMEGLKDKTVANFAQAIAGQLAGVRVLNSNNAPGGGTNIVIRGISSINASNNPLIVIDGFPLKDGFNKDENPLNSINPADIESVEVLKDASSSAIYGTQAANGVILITTKKGRTGKPTISINASTGFEQMTHRMNALNKEDFLKFLDDSRAQAYIVEDPNYGTNDPNAPQWAWTDSDATRIYNWEHFSTNAGPMTGGGTLYERWITVTPETKAQPYDTDWQDVASRIGKVNNIQISMNGGTENIKFMVSGGYFNQDGVWDGSGYNRFSFRANVEFKINKWLKAGLLLAPSLETTNKMTNIEYTAYSVAAIPPIFAAYDENGDPKYLGSVSGDYTQWNFSGFINPLANNLVTDNRRSAKNLSTIFTEINFTKDLTFRSEFHTEFKNWENSYFSPSSYPTTGARTSRPWGANQIDSRLYWNSQNFLTYNKIIGKHNVNAMLGYSVEETSYRMSWIKKYDYPTNNVPTLNQAVTILSSQNDARTNRSSETMIGSFGRAMYNYGGKYYLTASVRRDGSSKFGADKKWGVFPSFSTAWRVSDEPFFSPLKQYINDLKIRGGWGIIGNAGIGNYNALSTLSATSYIFESGSTIAPGYVDGKVSNSALGWETTTDYGLGVDVQLLDSRISLSADYFYKLTEDMLFNMPLPTITGFSSYLKNIGSMRNRGFEYMVTSRNFVGDFNWTTTANLSYYANRVLDTGGDKRPLIYGYSYTIEGKPLAGIWGPQFLGPYKDWEDVKTNPIVNPTHPLWRNRSSPGTTKLNDINADGIIDGLDNTIIGSANPDFVWGMTNTFGYKGFDLSIHINGVQGGQRNMIQMEGLMARSTGQRNTVTEYYENYWRPDRTDAKYAAPTRKSWDNTSNRGTLVFDATYVNIQNITFGYTLSRRIVQNLNIGQVRFYTSIQNALLITKYPGFNPEANSYGSSAMSQGIDAGSYPWSRIVSFGINVSL